MFIQTGLQLPLLKVAFAQSALLFKNSRVFNGLGLSNGSSLIRLSSYMSKMELFKGVQDRFNGITVDTLEEPCGSETVEQKINESLQKWEQDGKRCIWFKVDISNASLVPLLANRGFNFHHARDNFVMMFKWLPKDVAPNLPPASHTNVGVGGMVINSKNQVLAVSEKHYQAPSWKLPGGYVERGEDIVDAAIREVKEETGIDAKFQSIVAFRHTHKMMFGNSDIYIIVLMTPVNEVITIDPREINMCEWMDVNEYMNHPNVFEFNRLVMKKVLEMRAKSLKLNAEKRTYSFHSFKREMTVISLEDL